MRVETVQRLDGDQAEAVARIATVAARADGVSPLSEATRLAIRAGATREDSPEHSPHNTVRTGEALGRTHLLVYDGAHLIGYASLERHEGGHSSAEESSAEVVVDPGRRRAGVGRALLEAVFDAAPAAQVWSHGDLEAARRLASAARLTPGRQLWQMARSLGADEPDLPQAVVPEGFGVRAFVPGRDEQAWLEVNARAFADHAEQGRMTLADLAQREDEPWFDPAGLILVEDLAGTMPRLAASHWTKVAEPQGPGEPRALGEPRIVGEPRVGEVYVVAVDPAYRGLGLGRAVTILGLAHLQARGLSRVMLHVDGDNPAAVATYVRLGFERTTLDVMYGRAGRPE